MSDVPASGVMLRRAFLLLIGCAAAAYSVPSLLQSDGVALDTTPAPPAKPETPAAPHPAAPRPGNVAVFDGPATESYRAQRGQFYVTGTINGNSVHFLVDTGATYVALTFEDARALGFNMSQLRWNVKTHTANGDSENAEVTLGDIRLGRIVEYNVPALIMKGGGSPISLLGMSFLSRLRSWQISDGVLTIAS